MVGGLGIGTIFYGERYINIWKFKKFVQHLLISPPVAGQEWHDPVSGIDFVWVPEGCFRMGSPDKGYMIESVYEKPVHEVCVDGFWMSKTEVTNVQYRTWEEKAAHDSKEAEGFSLNDDNQPVVYVSWEDAKAYAKWLTQQYGAKYEFRLPTEAEWEYACRAGTTTDRFWGDNPDNACQFANVHDKTSKRIIKIAYWTHHDCDDGYGVASPVGKFQPNAFGLYDMLGNIREWCEDIYSGDAYSKHLRINPIYKGGGTDRVLRGGCWVDVPWDVRCDARYIGSPPDTRGPAFGFRLVRKD